MTSVADDAGRQVGYSYTGDLLVGVSSLGGGSWSYGYDASDRLTNRVDPTGAETVSAYGTDERVETQWDPNIVALGGSLDPGDGTGFTYSGFDEDPLSGTVTVTSPDGAVESVDFESGLVVSDTRGVGTTAESTWSFEFDPVSGLPTSATDPDNGTTSFSYDASGRWLASVTTPEGRVTTYASFDAFGNPGTVTDAAGTVTTMTYDAGGNVTSTSTPWKTSAGVSLGPDAATVYTRDSVRPDDVVSVTGPDGTTSSFTYTDAGLVASATDAAGGVATFGYDPVGHRMWSVSPEGNVSGGNPMEHRGVALVDPAGNALVRTAPEAVGMADGFVRTTSSGLGAAPTGEVWSTASGAWSSAGGVASAAAAGVAAVVPPAGSPDGVTIQSVIPSGVTGGVGVVFRYQDAANYWAATVDSGSLVVSKTVGGTTTVVATVSGAEFGAGDRLATFSNSTAVLVVRNGRTLWGGMDSTLGSAPGVGLWSGAAGPVSAGFMAGDPTGGLTSSFFDAEGRVTGTYGPRGNLAGMWSTTRVYDGLGNVVSVTDEGGLTTEQGFDVMGRMVTRTDPSGATTSWSYDVLGRVASTAAPGKDAATVSYSPGDYAASPPVPSERIVTEPDGVIATSRFTGDGLVATVSFSDATATLSNTFDALGRVVESTGAASTTRVFDTLGEPLSVTRGGRTVSYSYDVPGRVTAVTYPNGEVVDRGYDLAGRWVSVSDWDDRTTTFAYDADGNVSGMSMPNGIDTAWTRDGSGGVVGIDYSDVGGGLVALRS